MSEDAPIPLTEDDIDRANAEARHYVEEIAPHVGRLFGVDLNIVVGAVPEGAGMSTDGEHGGVIVDPRFFLDRGYKPEQAGWAIEHEVASHVKRIVNEDPKVNREIKAFTESGNEKLLFFNIFEDIAGNNLIHAVLPRQRQIAESLYRERLFPETDYRGEPRHMQFVEKIIRDEMVPDETVTVDPEVQAAIDGLRDFQGQGDVIKYSTAVAKSGHEVMSADERFQIWKGVIYPIYEKLLEQDNEDPRFDNQPGEDQTEGSTGQDQQDGDSSDQSKNQQRGKSQEGQQKSEKADNEQNNQEQSSSQARQNAGQRYSSYYKDYRENRHPEPFSEEEEQKLEDQIKQKMASGGQRPISHQRLMDEQVRKETGHSLGEKRRYDAEVVKWQEAIEDMRQTWRAVINERIAQKRGLSRRNFTEGAVLDPDRLVQTVIDVRNQVDQPEAFRDYETRRGQTEAVGKTDYIFIGDISSSMAGEKAQASASSGVILLEGLAALQRDIEEAEATHKLDLDLDIRTAIYTFGIGTTNTKTLSTKVSPKERLDSYQALSNPRDGDTQDYLAYEEVEKLPDEPDRRRIIIVLSDGISGDSGRTKRAVDRLRGRGWYVYGISIGSGEAEQLYSPTARRVDDPEQVPGTIRRFIEATIV